MKNIELDLLKVILPDNILNNFDIKDILIESDKIKINLDEKNIPPNEYSIEDLKSVGFSNLSTVCDFPIRDKALFLKIRRRKWFLKTKKIYIRNNFDLIFKGTKLSKEFGSFLKDRD